jgi:hypothetical protein
MKFTPTAIHLMPKILRPTLDYISSLVSCGNSHPFGAGVYSIVLIQSLGRTQVGCWHDSELLLEDHAYLRSKESWEMIPVPCGQKVKLPCYYSSAK